MKEKVRYNFLMHKSHITRSLGKGEAKTAHLSPKWKANWMREKGVSRKSQKVIRSMSLKYVFKQFIKLVIPIFSPTVFDENIL